MNMASYLKISIVMFLVLTTVGTLAIRITNEVHLDDVSPGIPCNPDLLERVDVLYVIPRFENVSILDHPEWCKMISSLNKTVGIHGVEHTYNEFLVERSSTYVEDEISTFEQCFGIRPTRFKPPQLAISRKNAQMLREQFVVDTWLRQRFHKVYHCNDGGVVPNWWADLI